MPPPGVRVLDLGSPVFRARQSLYSGVPASALDAVHEAPPMRVAPVSTISQPATARQAAAKAQILKFPTLRMARLIGRRTGQVE